MELDRYETHRYIRTRIQKCSDEDHVQQVAYSAYEDGLTQTCFTCDKVRTTIGMEV
jgi:hypothetical protein